MNNAKYFFLLSIILISASLITDNAFNAGRAYIVAGVFMVISFVSYIKPLFAKGEENE